MRRVAAQVPLSWSDLRDVQRVFEAMSVMIRHQLRSGPDVGIVATLTLEMAISDRLIQQHLLGLDVPTHAFALVATREVLQRRIANRQRSVAQQALEHAALDRQSRQLQQLPTRFTHIEVSGLSEAEVARRILSIVRDPARRQAS